MSSGLQPLSISVTCRCGARLRARYEHAGKRGQCPTCGEKLPIPTVEQARPDVFISYSSVEKATADEVCAHLESQGIRCWIAPRDVSPGDEYGEAIVDAITACRLLVLIFSSHANESPQVRREVERALSKGKTILPFRTENVLPSRALEYCLGNTQWLNAFPLPTKQHLSHLTQAVKRLVSPKERPADATPLVSPAPSAPRADVVEGASLKPPEPSSSFQAPAPMLAPAVALEKTLPQGYKLLSVISRTTSSIVMRVLDERSGQAAVLKRSTQAGGKPLDIRALGVHCPGILLPRKSWLEDNAAYELLDWVDGYTLAHIIQHAHTPIRGALLDHWVTTLVELAAPLHQASQPIIHRDITPSNVVVATQDLSLWLIDTSSACLAGTKQPPVGSPSYAPREQLAGVAVPASDIYSIGALAYHLAMDRLPPSFASRTQAVNRRVALGATPGPASGAELQLDTGGLRELHDWILLMLSLDPEVRPRDANRALALKEPEKTLMNDPLGKLPLPNGKTVIMNLLDFSIE